MKEEKVYHWTCLPCIWTPFTPNGGAGGVKRELESLSGGRVLILSATDFPASSFRPTSLMLNGHNIPRPPLKEVQWA